MTKIYIIIPTYNERENIAKLINAIFALNISNLHIIIVDDNSPDGTAQLVKKLISDLEPNLRNRIYLISRPEKSGLGGAYIVGFKYALGDGADLIFEMDADLSHDPKYIPNFIQEINNNYDVVVGSRRVKNGEIIGWNWWRELMSIGAMFLARIILNLKTRDVTTGYRCYTKKALDKIDLNKIKSDGYAFQEEMIYLCEKNKFRIKEVPIVFIDRKFGKSKLRRKDIIDFFITIFKLKK